VGAQKADREKDWLKTADELIDNFDAIVEDKNRKTALLIFESMMNMDESRMADARSSAVSLLGVARIDRIAKLAAPEGTDGRYSFGRWHSAIKLWRRAYDNGHSVAKANAPKASLMLRLQWIHAREELLSLSYH
jgi:hypothetical protein